MNVPGTMTSGTRQNVVPDRWVTQAPEHRGHPRLMRAKHPAPPKIAGELRAKAGELPPIEKRLGENYAPDINEGVEPDRIRLETLWHVEDKLVDCVDALEREDVGSFSTDTLVDFFEAHRCSDFLVRWSNHEIAMSAEEGKIPKLSHWADPLAHRSIGLDSLMNLAGLNSFIADQREMDKHVREVLAKKG